MDKVRARFVVKSKEEQGENGCAVRLEPVVANTEENAKYFEATPYGSIELGILNESASEFFVEGSEVYVDFTVT